jgi:uncharacterized protein YegP (UPF0339 family)
MSPSSEKKPQFMVHRRREGFSWVLKSAKGHLLAQSAKIYAERKSCIEGIKTVKKTTAEAELPPRPWY